MVTAKDIMKILEAKEPPLGYSVSECEIIGPRIEKDYWKYGMRPFSEINKDYRECLRRRKLPYKNVPVRTQLEVIHLFYVGREYWGSAKLIRVSKHKKLLISNHYSVSTKGRVWSWFRKKKMEPFIDKDGYYRFGLSGLDSSVLHRLVASTFDFDSRKDQHLLTVNHEDGIKYNNDYTNLVWTTNSENTDHALRTGLMKSNPISAELLMDVGEWKKGTLFYLTRKKDALQYQFNPKTVYSSIKKGTLYKGFKWSFVKENTEELVYGIPHELINLIRKSGKKRIVITTSIGG